MHDDSWAELRLARPNWHKDATCTRTAPDLFFSDPVREPDDVAYAKKVCGRCPVWETCLQWASARDLPYAVAGRLTATERQNLKPTQPEARRAGLLADQRRATLLTLNTVRGMNGTEIARHLDLDPRVVLLALAMVNGVAQPQGHLFRRLAADTAALQGERLRSLWRSGYGVRDLAAEFALGHRVVTLAIDRLIADRAWMPAADAVRCALSGSSTPRLGAEELALAADVLRDGGDSWEQISALCGVDALHLRREQAVRQAQMERAAVVAQHQSPDTGEAERDAVILHLLTATDDSLRTIAARFAEVSQERVAEIWLRHRQASWRLGLGDPNRPRAAVSTAA
ncbi:WhiB family transcriptional regulator [Streptomyces sp. NPDC002215]|uniref:WhiB family transcriptional regulator n=1 Tax=Streptomyces sp. NPDC002215 TaxID=3154412 RepID=UPI00331D1BD0